MRREMITRAAAILIICMLVGPHAGAQAGKKRPAPELSGEIEFDDSTSTDASDDSEPLDEEDNSVQQGQIQFETMEDEKDPYFRGQEEAIEYFTNFEKQITELAAGQTPKLSVPSERALLHLTGVYLHCSVKKGSCPLVLEALLETDVARSKLEKKVSCTNLVQFWKLWIANQMEQKHSYAVQTGYLRDTATFKREVLPKFVRCKGTIEQEIANPADDKEFFAGRYAPGSVEHDSVIQTISLLREVEKSKIHVLKAYSGTGDTKQKGRSASGNKGAEKRITKPRVH